jgi:hypothetical protein
VGTVKHPLAPNREARFLAAVPDFPQAERIRERELGYLFSLLSHASDDSCCMVELGLSSLDLTFFHMLCGWGNGQCILLLVA